MAAAFVTTAGSLEGQLLEIALKMELAEQAYNTANPNTPVNRISLSPNVETSEITISVTLPVVTSGVGAAITQTVANYLP